MEIGQAIIEINEHLGLCIGRGQSLDSTSVLNELCLVDRLVDLLAKLRVAMFLRVPFVLASVVAFTGS